VSDERGEMEVASEKIKRSEEERRKELSC